MSRAFSGGKRSREANRDLKKRQKAERLLRNRELRARGIDPDLVGAPAGPVADALPQVRLEEVVIAVPQQPRRGDFGPARLFIGGLGSATTAAELRTYFSRFGELIDAMVVVNRSGHSRGFGFVSYKSSLDANQAIRGADGVELDGHPLRVNRAETPASRL